MLDKVLEKLGVTSPDQLKPAELATWRQWTDILSKQDVSIDDLKAFCAAELSRANHELQGFENTSNKDLFYKAYATFAENMLKVIGAPQREKEQLREFLNKKYGIE